MSQLHFQDYEGEENRELLAWIQNLLDLIQCQTAVATGTSRGYFYPDV